MNVGQLRCCLSLQRGADQLQVKLIASFLISYPFAGVLKRIPDQNPYQKNLFIIAYALKLSKVATSVLNVSIGYHSSISLVFSTYGTAYGRCS